ncbi:PREDICTED: gamma-tubulin complex component 5-like [Thamnophis sirtalis]|uniref:Gamma-tubulin complex component 5-like n=1 Tax=Thamnophis sirtalis TaxID=35019 RepID=A0A6I9Y7D3_9SAUR|nr:PREDICTED: gamma-tubulin complex component 5-like [Thamnophis sirtalis]
MATASSATTPPAHWSRFDQEQDLAVRELIRQVTGLDERSPETSGHFQAALNFAWSNFRFHQFLDVSRHKVEKIMEGIYEKLVVHSDLVKAGSWRRLTEEFLNLSLPTTEGTKVCEF